MRTEDSDIKSDLRGHAARCTRHFPTKRFGWSLRVCTFLACMLGGLVHVPAVHAQEESSIGPASEDAPVATRAEADSDAAVESGQGAAATKALEANDSLWNRARVALPVEASVIGLTVGVRPEFLFQPFEGARWFELRAAAGVLPGPEYLSTPLSVGIRGRYLDFPVHPLLGIALTQDIYWISDAAPILRGIVETDVGLSIDVAPQWAVDAVAYGGWGAIGEPGPLAGLRLGIRYTPGASAGAP
jgi:hypothetical protein